MSKFEPEPSVEQVARMGFPPKDRKPTEAPAPVQPTADKPRLKSNRNTNTLPPR